MNCGIRERIHYTGKTEQKGAGTQRGFTKTEQNKEGENMNTAGRGLPIFIMDQNGRKQVECSHLRYNQREGGGGGRCAEQSVLSQCVSIITNPYAGAILSPRPVSGVKK